MALRRLVRLYVLCRRYVARCAESQSAVFWRPMRTCGLRAALTTTSARRAFRMGNACAQRASLVDSVLEEDGVRGGASDASPWLLARKIDVYATAARVFGDYKLVSWRCDQLVCARTRERRALARRHAPGAQPTSRTSYGKRSLH